MKTYLLQLEADQRDQRQPQANFAIGRNYNHRGRGINVRGFNNNGRGYGHRERVFNNSGRRHWIPKCQLEEGKNCFICEEEGHLKPNRPFLSDFIRNGTKRCYDCKVMHSPRDYCQFKHGSIPPEGYRYARNSNKNSNKIHMVINMKVEVEVGEQVVVA